MYIYTYVCFHLYTIITYIYIHIYKQYMYLYIYSILHVYIDVYISCIYIIHVYIIYEQILVGWKLSSVMKELVDARAKACVGEANFIEGRGSEPFGATGRLKSNEWVKITRGIIYIYIYILYIQLSYIYIYIYIYM